MADTPSTLPDNFVIAEELKSQSQYERVVWIDYPVSPETWKTVIDTQNKVATIIIAPEIKQNSKDWIAELKENFRETFIAKLKQLPDYEWSKVQEAVENETVEIEKIPWRDWYAIYESKDWNLVYITKLDWSRYTNVDYFRTRPWYEDALMGGYIRKWYWKIKNEDWLWKLFDKEWKEIPIYSGEYMIATLNAINEMWEFAKGIVEEANKRRKEWKLK